MRWNQINLKHAALAVAALSLVAAIVVLVVEGDDSPETISASELPAPLSSALDGLNAAGYEVQAIDAGIENTPTLVVEGDSPVVLMPGGEGYGAGFPDTLAALTEATGESVDRATEVICGDFVVAGQTGSRLQAVARAAGNCS